MIRRPPRSTPFPTTTPFRSRHGRYEQTHLVDQPGAEHTAVDPPAPFEHQRAHAEARADLLERRGQVDVARSEEHTSELQSRQYLVCRLLLDKTRRADARQDR